MGRKYADPLVGIPQDGHRNYNAGQSNKVDLKTLKFRKRARLVHYSLYIKGFQFDIVEEVAQVSQAGAIPASWLDLAGWQTARRPQRPDDPEDPPDAFWRTLVADRGKYDRNPPYYYARACKETIMKGGVRSNAVDTTALIYNERNSIIAEFCRRVQSVIWNRALIKTKKSALGLVSEDVRKGDIICIIYGCTVPVILRKGKLKTTGKLEMEEFEDCVEAMKGAMRKCEKNRARKARYKDMKEEFKEMVREDLEAYIAGIKVNSNNKPNGKDEPNGLPLPEIHNKEGKGKEGVRSGFPRDGDGDGDGDGDVTSEDHTEESDNETDGSDESDGEDEEGAGGVENGDNAGGETPETEERMKHRQEKAAQRDPYRHYQFLGEAYIHGMMDGEAVRQKFYKNKPDHVFEIR
jgi:hypothetical protein